MVKNNTDILIEDKVLNKEMDALLKRIWAKRKRPTEPEYKKLLFDTEISWYEINLIHAYQIMTALKGVGEYIRKRALAENNNFNWINRFTKDFNKKDRIDGSGFISRIDHAIKHLQRVCAFANNYKPPYKYEFEWLLDFDNVLAERLEAKYGAGSKRTKSQNKNQADYLSRKYGVTQ